ncbi:hypothetical protein HMPREF0345_2681 [Enterococcus faecalis ATCC 29200]|uniref:hypothetical protein n=1 Tax=Enterococcus faecalis TaxID=1351 RepID=UPI00019F6B9A|nr:hypothetical protein [Enterococcus faecalis]EEN70409.1 hypothetical protein HMPREF0345_2681 [Enterococcus faecalis ATCC 29200]EOJ04743.1 hypothetical protein UMK_02930 [Enterococcus faecalis ATCC 29200]
MENVFQFIRFVVFIGILIAFYLAYKVSKLKEVRKNLDEYDDNYLYEYTVTIFFEGKNPYDWHLFSDVGNYKDEHVLNFVTTGREYLPVNEENETYLLPVKDISHAHVSVKENEKLGSKSYNWFIFQKLISSGRY